MNSNCMDLSRERLPPVASVLDSSRSNLMTPGLPMHGPYMSGFSGRDMVVSPLQVYPSGSSPVVASRLAHMNSLSNYMAGLLPTEERPALQQQQQQQQQQQLVHHPYMYPVSHTYDASYQAPNMAYMMPMMQPNSGCSRSFEARHYPFVQHPMCLDANSAVVRPGIASQVAPSPSAAAAVAAPLESPGGSPMPMRPSMRIGPLPSSPSSSGKSNPRHNWSARETELFRHLLKKHGRNFNVISVEMSKTRDQVRQFYYRSLKRLDDIMKLTKLKPLTINRTNPTEAASMIEFWFQLAGDMQLSVKSIPQGRGLEQVAEALHDHLLNVRDEPAAADILAEEQEKLPSHALPPPEVGTQGNTLFKTSSSLENEQK